MVASFTARPCVAQSVEPILTINRLREVYTRDAVADRVEVTIRQGPSGWKEDFIVRVGRLRAPKSDAASGVAPGNLEPIVALELGDLRVCATGGKLVAVHTLDETACYVYEYKGKPDTEMFAKALPPLFLPEIALALDGIDATGLTIRGMTPYTPSITFDSAPAKEQRRIPDETKLTGHADPVAGQARTGAVTLIADSRTGRLRKLEAEIDEGHMQMDLRFAPVRAGNPADWVIKDEGRRRVASLTELGVRKGDAAAMKTVPELPLQDLKWDAWDWRNVFKQKGPPSAPERLVLVMIRENEAGDFENAAAKVAVNALTELQRKAELPGATEPAKEPPSPGAKPASTNTQLTFQYRVVLVAKSIGARTRERVQAGGAMWGQGALWASSPPLTIDRFAPSSNAAAVCIRADRSLAGVVLLDPAPAGTEAGDVTKKLMEMLAGPG